MVGASTSGSWRNRSSSDGSPRGQICATCLKRDRNSQSRGQLLPALAQALGELVAGRGRRGGGIGALHRQVTRLGAVRITSSTVWYAQPGARIRLFAINAHRAAELWPVNRQPRSAAAPPSRSTASSRRRRSRARATDRFGDCGLVHGHAGFRQGHRRRNGYAVGLGNAAATLCGCRAERERAGRSTART